MFSLDTLFQNFPKIKTLKIDMYLNIPTLRNDYFLGTYDLKQNAKRKQTQRKTAKQI